MIKRLIVLLTGIACAVQAADWPGPYTGPSAKGVDVSTLSGKIMCGYQGWFNAEGDGAGRGWHHWMAGRGKPAPGNIQVDLWPDVSELSPAERYATDFHTADGKPAELYSSWNSATTLRHFRWMSEYGIDGVFVQRFIHSLEQERHLNHNNKVLADCRAGANQFGRAYAVMYDLSGLKAGRIQSVIEDWKSLRGRMRIGDDPAYLHHRGKILVAVWGVGFNDDRLYTLEECRRLVEFLKREDCAVMLGVPTGWRTLDRDSIRDPKLHQTLAMAQVLSPWTVGRYRDPEQVARHADEKWAGDLKWCGERRIDYLPVVFPGFSWHNLRGGPLDQIPRLGGKFLWSQMFHARRIGATMIYQAMFDEVDEGTAIFKCTNSPPVDGKFITYQGLPPDHYLKLAGAAGRMLRGEIPPSAEMPSR